jgi:valyl-tRNA synthetase
MTSPETSPSTALPPTYDAASTESAWYPRWTEHGVFTANPANAATREPFVIVIPPPNVTAVLHMGHGLNNTVQDVLIRWRRMAGDEALWVPGTDHAGIATQNVVEKQLAAEGLTRFDVGREPFVERVKEFVERTGGEILNQLKSIGASADWTRTAYTFSPELSRAVREAFVRLHEDGLVYKGHRVIHWCPRCGTSLSDEEAEFTETAGKLYHLRYPLADDPSQGITVATTRPETMLGDVAVAVHPDDERYKAFVGRELLLPLNNVRIPVVADSYTDPAFGSGAVKITPAHDGNDFEVGKRHALPMPVIIDATGVVREVEGAAGRVPDALNGLDRFEARKAIIPMLEMDGALIKIEPHQHSVRHCYRCDTVVEPRLSDQWFVRMQPLADKALAALRTGELRILPERWEAVYVNWLEGIRDWNISRQIWWGHRVPVWYCNNPSCSQTPIVSRTDITSCPTCHGTVRQDEDVLDTWFSSWLWPFSTLGWPDNTPDLRAFYPGDVLVTAPEILFFWVARMVMSGCWFLDKAPFHTVYLHGTVRDMEHRKMSKSLGNGIDPLDVVRLFGADALRWTMVAGLGLGVDVMLDPNDLEKSFAPGRNFCTKLWNIGRFLLSRVGTEPVQPVASLAPGSLTAADHWILGRLDAAIADCDAALGPARPASGTWTDAERTRGLRLSEYAESARRFVWNELADWYLESVKPRLMTEGADREVARAVLAHAFDGALRLLHPIVPFITEELWQKLPQTVPGTMLTQAAWPVVHGHGVPGDSTAAQPFELVREAVAAIRQVRSEYNVNPGAWVEASLVVANGSLPAPVLTAVADTTGSLARARVTASGVNPGGASAQVLLSGGVELVVPLAGMIDLDKEKQRLQAELTQLDTQITALSGRLANEKFVSKAPANVVESERAKLAEWTSRADTMRAKLNAFGA